MSKNTCHVCTYVLDGAQHWWYGWWSCHHWYSFFNMTIICILLSALAWLTLNCYSLSWQHKILLYCWWVDIISSSLWICCSFYLQIQRQTRVHTYMYIGHMTLHGFGGVYWSFGVLETKIPWPNVELLWWEVCRNKSCEFYVFGESSQRPWKKGG